VRLGVTRPGESESCAAAYDRSTTDTGLISKESLVGLLVFLKFKKWYTYIVALLSVATQEEFSEAIKQ